MNNINFNQTGGFPLSTNILDAMQTAYRVFNALGELAGNKAIISGCEVAGNSVTDGVVYINGEILAFKGGTIGDNVIIKQDIESKIFEDGNSKEVLYKRYASFGNGTTTFPWSDFKRIKNLIQLNNDIETHNHSFNDLENVPTEFPPSTHTHAFSEITDKPEKYKPKEHTHHYNTIPGRPKGRIIRAGKVKANGTKLKTFEGDFTVTHIGEGRNKITHNIGHTNYIVLGQALSGNTQMKMNCYKITNNYCEITTADDASANSSDFQFVILDFSVQVIEPAKVLYPLEIGHPIPIPNPPFPFP